MRDADNGLFRVGDWRVESRLNRLSRDDADVRLEPKIMQVLLCLAERPGRVYSKDELISRVWKNSVVTEDVLARAVSELRRAFGDDPRRPSYIETIHKTGYRLIAPVRPDEPAADEPAGTIASGKTWFWGISAAAGVLFLTWLMRGQEPPQPNWQLRPATSLSGLEIRPSTAPDGTSFLFVRTGQDGSDANIYLKRFGEDAPLQLTDDPAQDGSPTWAPDGSRFAFIRYSSDRCAILVRALENAQVTELASCQNVTYPDLRWSNDGSSLAYNDRMSGDSGHSIVLVDAASGEQRKLTRPDPANWGDYDPVFSADDKSVFFARARSEAIQDLYRVDIETGTETQLSFDGRNVYGIDVTPDGESVIFSSNRGGQRYDLWEMPVEGGPASLYLRDSADTVNPSIASDGQTLLFEQRSYDFNIWMTDAESVTPGEPFSPSSRWEMYPAFSNDGRRVAFSSNRSGSYEIWVADVDGGNLIQLTSFDAPLTASPKWSPDDSELVFVSRPEGNADLFTIASDGSGTPVRVTSTDHDELAPSWSADGRSLYHASNLTGEWEVWKCSLDGGDEIRITSDGGFGAQESPDGQSLYFSRYQQPGIWRIAAGGEAVLVTSGLAPGDAGNWGVIDRGLYLFSRDGEARVELIGTDGKRIATLFEPSRPVPPGEISIAVSRDGQRLLYVQVDLRLADIVLASWQP